MRHSVIDYHIEVSKLLEHFDFERCCILFAVVKGFIARFWFVVVVAHFWVSVGEVEVLIVVSQRNIVA